MSSPVPTAAATAGQWFWFLNSLVRIGVESGAGSDGLSAIEHRVAYGDSPPLHSHASEDEFFYVLEGEFGFEVDGRRLVVGPGAMVLAPKRVVHTYRSQSPGGGRFLTVTCSGDFERFIRALGRPAERHELPPPAGPPSSEAMASLTELGRAHGITFHGPPMTEDVPNFS